MSKSDFDIFYSLYCKKFNIFLKHTFSYVSHVFLYNSWLLYKFYNSRCKYIYVITETKHPPSSKLLSLL